MSPPKTAGTRNKADIVAVIGASGTGKSSYIKGELLKKFPRLLVWSPLEETDDYAGFSGGVVVRGKISELVAQVQAGTKAIVYVPTGDAAAVKLQFDRFCRIAWEMEPATKLLVEELSGVTMPSWSPPAWRKLSTAGRHRGLTIIGVAQRPANIDKDFMGNCTEVRCYRVNYDNDAKVMADVLRLQTAYATGDTGKTVAKKGMDQLRELPNFHFFHKNPDLSVRRGINKSL
ncbi:hypothetical protein [Pseudoduganella namucuonensis]|uniref:Uncharacterized protein n=1 Tax=Pseudoduganella namucuonensis TaxID=1035707 RepID=A0A1I7KQF7_9BURK|nr:hypothetical protein [Pseudoduganella namucuonensis]SFU99596.1 hypothetical protein SAMN05216552_1018130 [Pseudoduganella namucuonensis]